VDKALLAIFLKILTRYWFWIRKNKRGWSSPVNRRDADDSCLSVNKAFVHRQTTP
jgi:hypothetical protein